MKYNIIFTTVIAALVVSSQLVFAGEITDTYTAGDTLTAAKMDNIKAAVNDNDTTKQDRVAGICAVGQSIRVINANGTVSCEVDTDTNTTYSAGSGISISGTTISARIGVNISVKLGTVGIPQGSTAVTQVASVTVAAPSSGYILVTHSGYAVLFGEPNELSIGIGDSAIAIDTDVRIGSLDIISTRRYEYAYTVQNLYTVAAGNRTFYGLAQKNTVFNAGLINVVPQSLSAIFIPNKY